MLLEVAAELNRRCTGQSVRHKGVQRCVWVTGPINRGKGGREAIDDIVESHKPAVEFVTIGERWDRNVREPYESSKGALERR